MNSNATAINNDDATSTTSLMTTMMQMMMEQQKNQQLMMFEHQKNQQELLNKFMEIQERQTSSLEKQTNSFSQLITQLISTPTLIASATSTSTSTTITSTPTPTITTTSIPTTFTATTPTATLDSIIVDNKDIIDAIDSSPEPKKTTSKQHAQPLEIETISKKKRKNEEEEEKDKKNKDKKQKVGNDTKEKEKEKEKEKKKSTTTTTTTTTTTSTLVLLNPICSYCNTKITAKKQITTTVFKNCHPMHIACSVQMICEDGQITCPAAKCGVECKTVMSLLNVKNFFLSRHLKYEQYYNDNLKFIKKSKNSITTEKAAPKTTSTPTPTPTATTSTPTLIHEKINKLLKESSKTTPTPISTPTTPTATTPTSPISNLTATVKLVTPQQQIIKEEYKVQPMDDLYGSSSSLLKAITEQPIANQYDDSDNNNDEDAEDLLDFWLLTRKKSNTRPFNNDQI